jgi:hypothetical protein
VNYGLRWDWFSREQERESEQANMVIGSPSAVPDSGRLEEQAAVAKLCQQPREGWHPAGLHRRVRQRSRQDAEDQFRSARRRRLRDYAEGRAAQRLRPVLWRVRESRRQPEPRYNYPFQFTLIYNAPNDTLPNRLPDGSLVGLDARSRVVLDPVNVNANGLTLRGVEFDYQTPRYHNYNVTLQMEPIPNHSVEIGFVGTRGRHLETFTGMNNVQQLLPPGTNPQPFVQFPISPVVRSTSGRSASAPTIRCRPSSSGAITPACSSS